MKKNKKNIRTVTNLSKSFRNKNNGVMGIVAGYGNGDTSSNPGRD